MSTSLTQLNGSPGQKGISITRGGGLAVAAPLQELKMPFKLKKLPPERIDGINYIIFESELGIQAAFKDANGGLWSVIMSKDEFIHFKMGSFHPLFILVSQPECEIAVELSPEQSAKFDAALKQRKDKP